MCSTEVLKTTNYLWQYHLSKMNLKNFSRPRKLLNQRVIVREKLKSMIALMIVYNIRDKVKLTTAPELMPGEQTRLDVSDSYQKVQLEFVLMKRQCHYTNAQRMNWCEIL